MVAATLPGKATHQHTRAFNQQLVLRAVYDHSSISRAEIARQTGLTRTSVSDLVGDLLREGLVEESGRGPSNGGKAPILLRVAADSRHIIGLDLGESAFSGVVVNLRGQVVRSLRLPLEGRDGEAALDLVIELVQALRADSQRNLLGVGIGAPGLIDSDRGVVRWAVNLDWTELALGPLLEERFGLPVVVGNDSQVAALAELTFFRRPRPQNLVVLRIGRGVGAGVILNGQLFQGDGYGAGEIGHVAVDGLTGRCRCGSVGCLETVASMRALVAMASQGSPEVVDEASLFSSFAAGDGTAREVALGAARHVGRAIAGLVGALSVRHVLIVGPVAGLGQPWLEEVRSTVRQSSLPVLATETRIDFGHVSDDIVALGASAMVMTNELGLSLVR
jgi:N-acetylglucosamine repressor